MITLNSQIQQVTPLKTCRFASHEEKEAVSAANQPQDTMEISRAGRQAAEKAEGGPGFDQVADELEANLRNMTKEDFMSMVREQLGGQKLEINWNAAVDPDHSIWATTYIRSLSSQCETARGVIEDYYSDAYQEALNNPLGSELPNQLNFIAGKYLCSWSGYFDSSMPADERQWTYTQVRALLTGAKVKLNDPYALAASGLDPRKMDGIARQAANDKISELIRLAKEDAGVTD